ncbi:Glycosyltransferase involved in cell wall bisynthesis [Ruegeria halocynthiae]|uniref:Glycosyltransferase involved in cell wall bisynthesis n=1 Tax=Ruegeria halocynthiae TaxID=985054 RepID=A0A1H2W690_9RHOB|nr:glycosyltransferase family 4 protein [Ruegeria halocynthiae]SDW76110.1 Glycosyltransferase involved in cell wall bisynthesis [Ruegeria halocynthiae]
MARVAFYAPMKSPDSPNPSGDREMARNLMTAIGAHGDKIQLASQMRIYDKTGDQSLQDELRRKAKAEAARLIKEMPADTDLWVTYHNYYKAPDLLGPMVCSARGIPYVQLESTRATSRLAGPWADFAHAAHHACDTAQVIFYHTANDLITLERERFGAQALVELPPFLPIAELPPASTRDGPMLTVGMMRPGDKLASYTILADTLDHLTGDWALNIVGDGPARPQVEALMKRFGTRVRFLGQLDRSPLQTHYLQASMLVWPGVNEAYGMVYLEAQASGVPVVAQDRPGVRDVLMPADHPAVASGAKGLAVRIQMLLDNPGLRCSEGEQARSYIEYRHLIPSATERFWSAVHPLLEKRT